MRLSALFGIGGVLLVAASCTRAPNDIAVYDNPPTATITAPLDGSEYPEGAQIDFTALVSDDGGVDALALTWSSSIDDVLSEDAVPDAAGNLEYSTASLSPGSHVINLSALDSSAQLGESQILIKIIDTPDNPTISVQHPSSGEVGGENEIFRFMVQVADADDVPQDLQVSLASNIDGDICTMPPDAAGVAYCDAVLSFAEHQLTFTVLDTDGNQAQAGAFFKVVPLSQIDNDGDGYNEEQGDCDDANNTIHPGATEVCDGVSQDCDAEIDEGTECYDDDGDGYTEIDGDCNDGNVAIHPNAPELPNGVDDNCDGKIDNGTNTYDDDGDGYCETPPCVNAAGTQPDCNDGDYQVNPVAPEVCDDGKDNNCNGLQQEQNAANCKTFYLDSDRDGYGAPSSGQCWCGSGNDQHTATTNNDCWDGNADARPGQTKYFTAHRGDGSYDYNCDGQQSIRHTDVHACDSDWFGTDCDGTLGWSGSTAPNCGQSSRWVGDCETDFGWNLFTCEEKNVINNKPQECR